ncbi:MAG: hypothetical protein JSS69_03640 [Acidobacteria bacterium]|nr:hypothetical protein [Acidobacteriota bacterium]
MFHPSLEWLASLKEEEYRELFRGSAMKRAKWRGILRNACNALGNSKLRSGTARVERIETLLQHLAENEEPSVAESAQWALSRIRNSA